jgi:flagellar basal body-associated protein FliL
MWWGRRENWRPERSLIVRLDDEEVVRQVDKAEKPRRRLPLLIVVGLVALAAVGATAWMGFIPLPGLNRGTAQPAAPAETVAAKETLPSFTVNLAEASYRRYLRVTITLEYDDKACSRKRRPKGSA